MEIGSRVRHYLHNDQYKGTITEIVETTIGSIYVVKWDNDPNSFPLGYKCVKFTPNGLVEVSGYFENELKSI